MTAEKRSRLRELFREVREEMDAYEIERVCMMHEAEISAANTILNC